MEALPQEIADKIFNKIFCEDPKNLYNLRLVCEAWKNYVDRCIARLLKIWCNKCSNDIPEDNLNDFIQTKFSQFTSWQDYCSSEFAMPNIARDIYVSWDAFPNLVGNPHHAEICPSPNDSTSTHVSSYAISDKYFAVSTAILMPAAPGRNELKSMRTQIYPTNALNHRIREYPILCAQMDFYATNNQVFIVFLEHHQNLDYPYTQRKIFVGEFLVNDCLAFSNLPVIESKPDPSINYGITKNQCFTFHRRPNSFQHHRWTANGFKMSTAVELPRRTRNESKQITKVQICHSKLVVSVVFLHKGRKSSKKAIYVYEITRQPDNKFQFSNPETYRFTVPTHRINFDTHIALQDTIFDYYRYWDFDCWVQQFFNQNVVSSVTVYAYHVLILCEDLLVVFRGNLRQLMKYAVASTDPGSRCTVIDLTSQTPMLRNSRSVSVIHDESKPKFLVCTWDRVFTIDFIR